ncbi:MAG TPA: L-2-hydroxyglutarate oxidase [Polyangiaceae bacterium]
MTDQFDYVVAGGGILGLSIARQILAVAPGAKLAILEKEESLGKHGSGRNSGVLHSGIYYPEASLKAKLCAEGAASLGRYCDERNLPISRIGKVVLPVRPEDDDTLHLLLERARNNGATARLLDAAELAAIEPSAHTITGRAVHVPSCSVVDSIAILKSLAADLTGAGALLLFGHRVAAANAEEGTVVCANGRKIGFGHFINAAGLHADRVAHLFGVGLEFSIMPFKGTYYDLDPALESTIRGLIYPVPDLRLPFLGVHLTKSVGGHVYLGPNALPALGRENYGGLEGVEFGEGFAIMGRNARQYWKNEQGFRRLVHEEVTRISKTAFVRAANALVPTIRAEQIKRSEKVGIRAQLYDKKEQKLVMDFLVHEGPKSTHVLNAVSPGFTCGPSFGAHVVDQYLRLG